MGAVATSSGRGRERKEVSALDIWNLQVDAWAPALCPSFRLPCQQTKVSVIISEIPHPEFPLTLLGGLSGP